MARPRLLAIGKRYAASWPSLYRVSSEVKAALAQNRPVVGLESTIISHGMPYPQNLETALSVEAAVRAEGATPATIAILDGHVCVGLNQEQIETLAQPDANVAKVSRRNFARVLAQRQLGSTTVAATMMACHQVGIAIFATGGIGGVHRGGEDSMDISADLVELGKTRVGVVCAGVKSILDIPRTLEVLETQGVLVATVGTDLEFPAFFSRRSGSASVAALSELECAETMAVQAMLQLDSGCVFACPIPEAYNMGTAIDQVIEQELDNAKTLGVHGKDVTPHLLGAINKATAGASLAANVALIHNNARVAARIAGHLSRLQPTVRCYSTCAHPSVVVMGGATVDTTAHSTTELVAGSTAYGRVTDSHGGVARNIAQGLGQLGLCPSLATALGEDEPGQQVCDRLQSANVDILLPRLPFSTARYIATLDPRGSLVHAVADMRIFDQLSSTLIHIPPSTLQHASLIVLDGNAFSNTVDSSALVGMLSQLDTPLWLEPTSTTRAKALVPLLAELQPRFISPDIHEFIVMAEGLLGRQGLMNECQASDSGSLHTELLHSWLNELAAILPNTSWIVTLGAHGVIAPSAGSLAQLMVTNGQVKAWQYEDYPACSLTKPLASVTGAGDSLVAGMVAALVEQRYTSCVAIGLKAAQLSLQSAEAIAADLKPDILATT